MAKLVERATKEALALIARARIRKLPVQPRRFFPLVGVKTLRSRTDKLGSGSLNRGEGGYVIEVNAKNTPAETRFASAHQLAHIIVMVARGDQTSAGNLTIAEALPACSDRTENEERLCDQIAAMLLLPPSLAGKWLRIPITLDGLDQAARNADVSPDVAALVLIPQQTESVVFVSWCRGDSHRASTTWHASRIVSSLDSGLSVAKEQAIRDDISKLFNEQASGTVVALGDRPRGSRFRIEFRRRRGSNGREVISLVWPVQ
ncbi:MAG: ImmA/IrrE family metallo-endopeptidase [Candidatus Solibacter sp.]